MTRKLNWTRWVQRVDRVGDMSTAYKVLVAGGISHFLAWA